MQTGGSTDDQMHHRSFPPLTSILSQRLSNTGMSYDAHVHFPELKMNARYKKTGLLIGLPAIGQGYFEGMVGDILATIRGTISWKRRDGQDFLHLERLDIDCVTNKVDMQVKNAFKNPIINYNDAAASHSAIRCLGACGVDVQRSSTDTTVCEAMQAGGSTDEQMHHPSFAPLKSLLSRRLSSRGTSYTAQVKFPELKMDARYRSSGDLVGHPASGQGKFEGMVGDVLATVRGTVSWKRRDGKDFLHLDRLDIDWVINRVDMQVKDVFNNPIITEETNRFLGQKKHDVLRAIKPQLRLQFSEVFLKISNQLLSHVPKDMFLL
ncbi:hypothetical protein C0J52_04726 [Blattella germanica]|nr:hypothetical protein C0J52_04726 [Blattella germanica]